ncbi:hypothetical protein ABW19_dt0210377 [Dactylella cylindrospora]|nr:hypothetical protein ABW19_dt0210377 [Dactylella cylindrospora]
MFRRYSNDDWNKTQSRSLEGSPHEVEPTSDTLMQISGSVQSASSTASEIYPNTFGIEIEITLRPVVEQVANFYPDLLPTIDEREGVTELLFRALTDSGVAVKIGGLFVTGWDSWMIQWDLLMWDEGFFPFEITSRILSADDFQTWAEEVETVFRTLEYFFDLRTNFSCGFHVHFATVPKWEFEDLKSLSKAIICFDPLIDALLPAVRRESKYCQSVIFNPQIIPILQKVREGRGYDYAFKNIDKMPNISSLVFLISPSRYTAWNFRKIVEASHEGTVEFRRPPGVDNASDAIQWICFVHSFRRAAMSPDCIKQFIEPLRGETKMEDLEYLERFVTAGAERLGYKLDIIRSLFAGKSYHPIMTKMVTIHPASQRDIVEESRKERHSFASEMIVLYQSSASSTPMTQSVMSTKSSGKGESSKSDDDKVGSDIPLEASSGRSLGRIYELPGDEPKPASGYSANEGELQTCGGTQTGISQGEPRHSHSNESNAEYRYNRSRLHGTRRARHM